MQSLSSQVLIVDDDDFALDILENILSRLGFTAVTARDGQEAMEILRRGEIHLVITDWDMPTMTGVELCRAVRREDTSGYVYIIMLTGREGARQRMEGLCAGADDFINKPVDPEELLVCLKTAERILSLETRDLALFALAKLAESRDTETGAHVERVQSYTRLIAQNLSQEVRVCFGVDDEFIRLLHQTSPLHDLGKVAIPDAVLLKPGKLTHDEFEIMKTHTIVGARTLDAALKRFPSARFLQIAREIAATHHEKFDGSGYPHGLAGEQIPLCGRIVAVADVYDALTSRRVYKDAMTHEQARAIILHDRGSHFDPEVVDAFMRAESQIVAVGNRLRDDEEAPVDVAIPPAPPPRLPTETTPCKILVVEDDPLLLQKVAELLTATGETIFTAADGEEAMRIFDEQKPRVIISDWVMPRLDGVEMCRLIRTRATSEPAHFIMLTAHSDKSRLLDAYEAGIDDFISKPFNHEELLARVRAGLRAAKLRDDLIRKASGSQALNAQLATLNSRLERLSITDELTGLFNRRHALARLEEQWALVDRYTRSLTIAMIDIDHFKKINDLHGHAAGDVVLRKVAEILREQTRGTDAVCRMGGEEFLILFPSQTAQEALVCAERFRAAVATHVFSVNGIEMRTTVSIGLASRTREMTQFTDLLKSADLALYSAKHGGRNNVRLAEKMDAAPPKEQAPAPAPPAVATPVARRQPIDMEAVTKRYGGDLGFAAAIGKRFQTQAGGEVSKIVEALARGDADSVRRLAHSLKSMAAYVAADLACDLSRQIENLCTENRFAEVPPLVHQLREEVDRAIAWIAENGFAIAA
jgi:putative two-component system response regulator